MAAIGFGWAHRAFESGLLHSSDCHCSDLDLGVWRIRHAPWPGHSQQGIHINIGLLCPIIQLKIVVGQAGHQLVTCSIQLGCGQDIGQGIVVILDIKSRGTHEISQLQPIWGWDIPAYGQGSEIWPLSDSYWCRQWQHPYHHCKSGRA